MDYKKQTIKPNQSVKYSISVNLPPPNPQDPFDHSLAQVPLSSQKQFLAPQQLPPPPQKLLTQKKESSQNLLSNKIKVYRLGTQQQSNKHNLILTYERK